MGLLQTKGYRKIKNRLRKESQKHSTNYDQTIRPLTHQNESTTNTTQRTRTHAFKIPNTINTIRRGNCKSLWDQTYYLDNSLQIEGYQMGEISVLGFSMLDM
jgi:hypothetical protein